MQAGWVENTQISATCAALRDIFGECLLAVYLHGSAVSDGLKPQSDIDLLVVLEHRMTDKARVRLLASLLRLSSRHPAVPNGSRCLEVIVFSRPDLVDGQFPARAEFVYGEWLRDAFEAGEIPMPADDPELTLVLAQARHEAVPLMGPDRGAFLPEVPMPVVRQAMCDMLPSLVDDLQDDTRNVVLTLARMWRTASDGYFVSKDEAAIWAGSRLSAVDAATLDYARRAYLGEVDDAWQSRRKVAERLAESLKREIFATMEA